MSIILIGITSIINHSLDGSWLIYDLNYNSKIAINNNFIIKLLDYWCIITFTLLSYIKFGNKLLFWIIFFIVFILVLLPQFFSLDRKKYIYTHNLIHIIIILSIIYFLM